MAVKLRASKVQPLAATTPTYLDYEGLVELVSKLKATYATQLSLDDYLTTSAAASTYQPIGDYALDSTIESLKSDILTQWAVHCEDGEILQYTSSDNRLVLTSRGFSNEWGTRLESTYTTAVYVRTICGEHIFGSTTDIDVASLIGLSSYALKADIPTNVSAFTNDAGYITAAEVVEPDLSGYVTTSSLATTLADYAKTSDLPTLSSLGGVGSVSASGTSPLTLSASKSGTTVNITGSVDLSSYVTSSSLTSTLADYAKSSDIPTLSSLSGIGTVNASGTSPLTLSASKSGTTVTISGSVDLSAYATTSTLTSDYYTKTQVDSLLEDVTGGGVTTVNASGTSPLTLSASKSGTTVSITGSVDLSAYATTSSLSNYVTSSSLTSTLADYAKASDIPTLSSLGGIGTVTASGTSPLTLSASKSGTSVTISGSVDLSSYATQSWVQEQIADAVTGGTVDLSEYATKTWVEEQLAGFTSDGITSISMTGDNVLSFEVSESNGAVVITGSADTYTKSEISSMISTASGGGITGATTKATYPLSLSTNVSDGLLTITGSVDLGDYSTTDEITEVLLRIATDGGLSQRSDGVTLRLTQYYPRIFGSTYTGVNSDVTFKTVGGESIFGSGNVDLSGYAKVEDVMESFVEIAESNMLSQNRDGVTLRLTSYYPKILGDANGSYSSDVTFKTVAGESIFGSGDVALDDFADKATVITLANFIYRASAMISTNNSNTAINFYGWEPSGDWLTGSLSNTVTINFNTINGYPILGTGDITIDSPGTATADELGLVRPWYDTNLGSNAENLLDRQINEQSTTTGRYYGVSAVNGRLYVNVPWEGSDVDLSSYATQAWVQEYVTDVVTGGTVDLTAYATKSDVISLAKNQYSCFWATRSASSNTTTIGFDFWLPDGTSITGGDENQRYALYFANINGNSIVGTSSSQVGNLTISDLGGVSADELADYADKAGTLSLMQAMAHDSELVYIEESQWLQYEMFYPNAWGETSLDGGQKTYVAVRTIAGQHIFGDTDDIDPTPWAVKIGGIDEVPGYLTSYIGNTAFSGTASGVIYSAQRICPYVISGSTATVYANWNSSESLKYNTATGLDGTARMDLVFVYDNAAYVYNGFSLNGIGESTSDLADLQRMRYLYPSATLRNMLDTWFDFDLGDIFASSIRSATIVDYDPTTYSCRIRFCIGDNSKEIYQVRVVNMAATEYFALAPTFEYGEDDYRAHIDLVVPYKDGTFISPDFKYYITD